MQLSSLGKKKALLLINTDLILKVKKRNVKSVRNIFA